MSWTTFAERLPTAADAFGGMVHAKWLTLRGVEHEGPCLWDWIPASTANAKDVWAANGFIAWKPLEHRAAASMSPDLAAGGREGER